MEVVFSVVLVAFGGLLYFGVLRPHSLLREMRRQGVHGFPFRPFIGNVRSKLYTELGHV